MTPSSSGIFNSPIWSSTVARLSMKIRARCSASSSASRMSARKAPIRSICWPGASQSPSISGSRDIVAQLTMSDAITALSRSVATSVLGKCAAMSSAPGGGAVPDHELAPSGRASRRPRASTRAICPAADDEDAVGIRRRQQPGGEQRIGRRLPLGDEVEIDDRLQRAVIVAVEVHRPVDRRHLVGGVLGKHRRGLHRHAHPVDPGRTGEQGVGLAVEETVGDLGPRAAGARRPSRRPSSPQSSSASASNGMISIVIAPPPRSASPAATSRAAQPSGPSNRCACQPRASAAAMLSGHVVGKQQPRPGAIAAVLLDDLVDPRGRLGDAEVAGDIAPVELGEERPGASRRRQTRRCRNSTARTPPRPSPAAPAAAAPNGRSPGPPRSSQRSCHIRISSRNSGQSPRPPRRPSRGNRRPGRPARSSGAGPPPRTSPGRRSRPTIAS